MALYARLFNVSRFARGLITRARAICTFPPLAAQRRGERACLRRASNQRRTRPSAIRTINRFSILAPQPGIVSAGKSRRLCVLCCGGSISPARVRINCERINAPFGDDDSLFARAFAFTRSPTSSTEHHHLEDAIADEIN